MRMVGGGGQYQEHNWFRVNIWPPTAKVEMENFKRQ
jgi:hypothetical protein